MSVDSLYKEALSLDSGFLSFLEFLKGEEIGGGSHQLSVCRTLDVSVRLLLSLFLTQE